MAENNDQVEAVKRIEAQRWLGVSEPTYNALERSGLLGRVTDDGYVFWEDLQHYRRFGPRWRTADFARVADTNYLALASLTGARDGASSSPDGCNPVWSPYRCAHTIYTP